ncbi:MAG: phosphoenolpyruvate--protein phosphotransferase [Deltaproteobacteria bacterium]|nr:phosphoenolpyruvate--protein phosphotransferase [Deltaproteobacteria bacterium]
MSTRIIRHPPAAPGIAIGRAHLVTIAPAPVPTYWITDTEVAGEIQRFRRALQQSKRQLTSIKNKLCRFQGREQIQILDSHLLLIQDELLVTRAIQQIANQKINAEWAVEKTLEQIRLAFLETRERYLQERRSDIDYIGRRLMKNLAGEGEPDLRAAPYPAVILVVNDLSPAEVAALPRRRIRGFVTATGGNTSHTAIIARSLELPAMVGNERALHHIKEGDHVILDGNAGKLLIRPTVRQIASYRKQQRADEKERRTLLKEGHLPAVTRDGRRVTLAANIELIDEIPTALEYGAEEIGMYRTEYLYLNRSDLPTEEEHYRNYREAVERMAPRPVTIRTLDIGGDKLFAHAEYQEHTNPALGLRAIRFCLREREMFRAQLRAIYRASARGAVRILFPLISTVDELRELRVLVREVQAELRKSRRPFNPDVPLGAMIEVPSAALVAEHLAPHVQFFSIGTNDLTQYSLAIDRTNEHVAYLFHPLHPSVLRLIHQTVQSAKRHGIPVTICGEMAAEPLALLPLLGLELDGLSMNPISIPRVKRLLWKADAAQAAALAAQLTAAATATEAEAMAQRALQALEADANRAADTP